MSDELMKGKRGRPEGAPNKTKREFTRTLRDAAEKYKLASVVVSEWELAKADMSPAERFRASLDLASLVVKASPRDLRVEPVAPRLLINGINPVPQLSRQVSHALAVEAAEPEEKAVFEDYRFTGGSNSGGGEEEG
jgi:hypothetical protein